MKKFKRIVSFCSIFTFIISNFLFVTNTKATTIANGDLKGRVNLNFNTGWKFYRGESLGAEEVEFYDDLWESVNLPHSVRLEPRSWKGTTPSYQGICWYRRDFTLDKSYEGKKVFVEFEGA
ncbi:hypothetical protein, partial [Clostridium sp.]|uniref:hypothetical protein n=1 Tax=Clostridium sp. TaxID=1506 RepID=UPI003F35CCAE